MGDSSLNERIDALHERASRDRAAFEPPADPPDTEAAQRYLREGVAPVLAVYVEARTGEWVRFDPETFSKLERAMNAWLECYAGCYGVDLEATFALRTAAEALLDTRDVSDVARVLTKVPSRNGTASVDV